MAPGSLAAAFSGLLLAALLSLLTACGPADRRAGGSGRNEASAVVAPAAPAGDRRPATAHAAAAAVPLQPAAAAPGSPRPAALSQSDWHYFRESGHYVAGGFRAFFEARGGLDVFGFPITEEQDRGGRTVQYFQRARMEWWPELPPAQRVQLGLLGDLLSAETRHGPASSAFAPVPRPEPEVHYFPETGHTLRGVFRSFFESRGGLDLFGYPIAEEYVDPTTDRTVQWFQRARMEWWPEHPTHYHVQLSLLGDWHLARLPAVEAAVLQARALPPETARAETPSRRERAEVRAGPNSAAEQITRLPQDAQVTVTGEARAPDGGIWYAVRLWNTLDGWLPLERISFDPAPPPSTRPPSAPWKPPPPGAQGPFAIDARGHLRAAADLAGNAGGPALRKLAAGTAVQVTAWATDAAGQSWFAVTTAAGDQGWLRGHAVRLKTTSLAPAFSTPSLAQPERGAGGPNGRRSLDALAGKGMWFTYDVLRETPVRLVVETARANGFSFLAPSVGSSREGYWGGPRLDALLIEAHAAGLKVIPWVYAWLVDVPGDLELARRALAHEAPGGHRVDGVGVDLEENFDEEPNYVFGQLLRQVAGPDLPLVAVTFQPQHQRGQRTPYAALAESFDVIAPMAYWHLRPVPYSEQDAYAYVADAIRLIRRRTGNPAQPVAVIGQAFDWFARNEIGAHNPTADEIRGALRASRDHGALGVGLFNWFHATPDEWAAIGAFPW